MSAFPVRDPTSGWRLAPEPPPAAAWSPQVVLAVALLDAVTGLPPSVPPVASTTTVGMLARATSGGLAGLVGSPLGRWMPDFVTGTQYVAGGPLQLSLAGSGFLPVSLTATIAAQPGFPATFVPVDLGSLALHRNPVSMAGRTVSRTRVVRAGASVTLDGVWLTLADLANPATPPDLVALASPIYADRDATATVAQQNLTAVAPAQAKTLLRAANVGDTLVRASDQVGLAVGSIIALDPQDPGRAEYLAVTAITDLGANASFPAVLTLGFPLARPHPTGATVIQMIPAAAGTANTLAVPGSSGDVAARSSDVTVFPSAMTGLDLVPATPPTVAAVTITGGGGGPEYHAASLLAGTSDAAGYVRLPPVHRVAQLRLRVHHPAEPNDLLRDVMLPLGVNALTLDLVFP